MVVHSPVLVSLRRIIRSDFYVKMADTTLMLGALSLTSTGENFAQFYAQSWATVLLGCNMKIPDLIS